MPYRNFSLEELLNIAGKHTEVVVKETEGGKAVFMEYGARLIGLYPNSGSSNLLWVYDQLDLSMKANQWMTGGERVWVSPERNFYYENPRDFEGFHIPAGIDPGNFSHKGDLTYKNVYSLLNCRANETYDECETTRRFELVDDPYSTNLPFVGVKIEDMVSIPAAIDMAAWSLAQIYTCGPDAPGTVFYPVQSDASILGYFKPIPEDRADVKNGYARFKIDADAIYKLGIRPEDMRFDNPCKSVYVSPSPEGDSWFCVIKRSNDMPKSQEECVDVPRSNPKGPMGAIQSYNNGPGFSVGEEISFGEIELQLTKGITKDGITTSRATHELFGYRGNTEQILYLAQTALGLGKMPELF